MDCHPQKLSLAIAAILLFAAGCEDPPTEYSLVIQTDGICEAHLEPPGGRYPAGTEVMVTLVPHAEFEKYDVYVIWDDRPSHPGLVSMVNMDSDVYGRVGVSPPNPAAYYLVLDTGGMGTIRLDPPGTDYGSYLEAASSSGAIMDVTITANPGYVFSSIEWNDSTSTTANPCQVTMDQDRIGTVLFVPE